MLTFVSTGISSDSCVQQLADPQKFSSDSCYDAWLLTVKVLALHILVPASTKLAATTMTAAPAPASAALRIVLGA